MERGVGLGKMSAPSTSILSVITVTRYRRKIWLLYLLPSMNLAVMTLSAIWFNCLFFKVFALNSGTVSLVVYLFGFHLLLSSTVLAIVRRLWVRDIEDTDFHETCRCRKYFCIVIQ